MLRLIHIFGAVMFLGGIMSDLVWMAFAQRTKRPANLAISSRTVTLNDFFVVLPGAGILLLSGFPMILASAEVSQLPLFEALLKSLQVGWLIVSFVMFNVSGMIWLFLALPCQRRLAAIAEQNTHSESLPDEFYSLLNNWYLWSGAATVTPLIALILMVLKPSMW